MSSASEDFVRAAVRELEQRVDAVTSAHSAQFITFDERVSEVETAAAESHPIAFGERITALETTMAEVQERIAAENVGVERFSELGDRIGSIERGRQNFERFVDEHRAARFDERLAGIDTQLADLARLLAAARSSGDPWQQGRADRAQGAASAPAGGPSSSDVGSMPANVPGSASERQQAYIGTPLRGAGAADADASDTARPERDDHEAKKNV